jgi:hypothetical protein
LEEKPQNAQNIQRHFPFCANVPPTTGPRPLAKHQVLGINQANSVEGRSDQQLQQAIENPSIAKRYDVGDDDCRHAEDSGTSNTLHHFNLLSGKINGFMERRTSTPDEHGHCLRGAA